MKYNRKKRPSNLKNPSFINLEDLKFFCKEKGFSEEDFFKILTSVIKRVLEERIDQESEIEVEIDSEKTVRVFNLQKTIIEDEKFAQLDEVGSNVSFISLSNAKQKFGEEVEVGKQVRDEIFLRDIPWVANFFADGVSREIKRLHCSRLKDTYQQLIGETLRVSLIAKNREGYLLRNVESPIAAKIFLSNYDVMRGKEPKLNEIFEVYVKSIDVSLNGNVKVIVSTVADKLLKEILTREVPELQQNIIKIVVTATSNQHNRSKIAVAKVGESQIDPIGCFVGNNGSRMKSILAALKGQKISVIEYKEDRIAFIVSALSPARVVGVLTPRRKQNLYTVIIPDQHHSLAIGTLGSNVALASMITNSSLDLVSLSDAEKRGLKFTWNGNLTPQEVELLKQGERLTPLHEEARAQNAEKKKKRTQRVGERKRRQPREFGDSKFERRFGRGEPSFEFGFNNFDVGIIDAELDKLRLDYDNVESFDDFQSSSAPTLERRNLKKEEKRPKEDFDIDKNVLLGIKNDEHEEIFDNIEKESKNWN